MCTWKITGYNKKDMIVWVILTKNNHCCCFLFWKKEWSAHQQPTPKYKMSLGNCYQKPPLLHTSYIVWSHMKMPANSSPRVARASAPRASSFYRRSLVLALLLCPRAVLLLGGMVGQVLAARPWPNGPWGALSPTTLSPWQPPALRAFWECSIARGAPIFPCKTYLEYL